MSRQDIHNIQYQLNLQCIEKHSNDYMSVSAWVAEMQDLAYNPVLVFKIKVMSRVMNATILERQIFYLHVEQIINET